MCPRTAPVPIVIFWRTFIGPFLCTFMSMVISYRVLKRLNI
jgi:hypothetical protein